MYQYLNINLDANKQMPVQTIKIDEYHSGHTQTYQCINNKTSIQIRINRCQPRQLK